MVFQGHIWPNLEYLQVWTFQNHTSANEDLEIQTKSYCHTGHIDNTVKTILYVFLHAEHFGGLVLLVGDVW